LDNCVEDSTIIHCVDDEPSGDKAENCSISSRKQLVGRRCRRSPSLAPAGFVTQMNSIPSSLNSNTSYLILTESVTSAEPQETYKQATHHINKEACGDSHVNTMPVVLGTTNYTNVSNTEEALHFNNIFSRQLNQVFASLDPEDLMATLSTLRKIFNNIVQHPNDEKYRQIKLSNKTFSCKVWKYPVCKELMKMSGWVVEDHYVKLKDDSHVHFVLQSIEPFCNDRVKCAETQSSPDHGSNKVPCSDEVESDVIGQIVNLFAQLSQPDFIDALTALNDIYQTADQHGKDKQCYQIKLTDEMFNSKVWRHPVCQRFMEMNGWVVEDNHVKPIDDSRLHIAAQGLSSFRNCTTDSHLQSTLGKQDSKRSQGTILSVPQPISDLMVSAIFSGSAYEVKILLSNYDPFFVKHIHVSWIVGDESIFPLIDVAYIARQIGIARILVNEYMVDPNGLGTRRPNFGRLFFGCDSSETCQSLIIEFIKEFKLEVGLCDTVGSSIHYAVMYRLFNVLKYLVENCKVNVNQAVFIGQFNGATALHMAYGLNEIEMANYLIKHGANENLIDYNGKRPQDYQFGNDDDTYCSVSKKLLKFSKLFRDIKSKEYQYYNLLVDRGTHCLDAVDLTYEKYPELNDEFTPTRPCPNLEIAPTMKELNHYITDMAPEYYSIGLELEIHNKQLKVIKNDPSLFNIKHKCHAMLELWLDTDTSASWKKLCDALQETEVGLCTVAERIKKYLETI